jgi:heavy metal response regulator
MRILIVEDKKRVAEFLRKGFQAEMFAVDIAPNGERGSYLARTEQYDAIILDVMLPGMSGIDLLKDIRGAKINTPVLVLSAKSDLEDRIEGLNMGADDYLPKPFAFSEALARVRALVRRTVGTELTSILQIADLKIDLHQRRVRRAGKSIPLTNKEYEVLEYLLRNKGRVLSRVILTEHVWNMNFDSDTNIVDVVINRLRRKIDDSFSHKLIHTIRGAGYVLKEVEDDEDTGKI